MAATVEKVNVRPRRRPPVPSPGGVRGIAGGLIDRLAAFDPGFNSGMMALTMATCLALTIPGGYLLEHITHLGWIHVPAGAHLSAAQRAEVHAQHHGYLLMAMLLSGGLGAIGGLMIPNDRAKVVGPLLVIVPAVILGIFAAAAALHGHRPWAFALLIVLMAFTSYAARFVPLVGPLILLLAQLLPIAWLMGYLSGATLDPGQVRYVAAWFYFAAAIMFVAKVLFLAPLARGAMPRTVRAVFSRARATLRAMETLLEAPRGSARDRAHARLRRRMVRLNEAALTADGLLGAQADVAAEVHVRLFQTELTAQNLGRTISGLADRELPGEVRSAIVACLTEARDTEGAMSFAELGVVREHAAHVRASDPQLAEQLGALTNLFAHWRADVAHWLEISAAVDSEEPFESPVMLMGGALPGAALVAKQFSSGPTSLGSRVRLSGPAQGAIRAAVAIAAAAVLGSVVNDHHFYWAVIAVFVAFMGTPTAGDQLGKCVQRVVGTVVGIFVGGLLAHAIGQTTWSIPLIVFFMSAGIYFMRFNYALMVIGLTVMLSQLYEQTGEFSNHVLVIRLEENLLGAGVAALAALLIFPVRNRGAARVAAREFGRHLGELIDGLVARISGDTASSRTALSRASRAVESSGAQLRSAAHPLTRDPLSHADVARNTLLFDHAGYHARNAVAELEDDGVPAAELKEPLIAALRALRASVESFHEHRPPSPQEADAIRRTGETLSAQVHDDSSPGDRQLTRDVLNLGGALTTISHNLGRFAPPPQTTAAD